MGKRRKGDVHGEAVNTIAASEPEEEIDFPRGGASVLTPDEIKEAKAEAEAEFDHESQKTKRGKPHKHLATGNNDLLFGNGWTGNGQKTIKTLRYKSLSIGMKLWGAVVEVSEKDLVINLPGGLHGFVRSIEISDVFDKFLSEKTSAKLQGKLATTTVSDGKESSQFADDALSPVNFFSVGQLLPCIVNSLEQTGGGEKKDRKRIELSLKLSRLHEGFTIESFHEGLPVLGYVRSVEDHGYLVSFGVLGVSGFLLHKSCEDALKLARGQLVQGVVQSVDKKRATVTLKSGSKLQASCVVHDNAGLTLESLLPGSMVNARVQAVLPSGLLLSFLTFFTGTVDIFHLDAPLVDSEWRTKYSENQRLKARIIVVDVVNKSIRLTLNSDLLRNSAPLLNTKIGKIFERAVVQRVDHTIGLLLELPMKSSSTAGYAHISNVSDDHIEKLEKRFSKGMKVRARVIGFRIMDGLAIVSLKESVLKQLLLSCCDVTNGLVVHATVTAVESHGAFVQLADGVQAYCPVHHMSEHQRVTPSPKFHVGTKLKFRVVKCDVSAKRILVTHKKTMVSSKLVPLTRYEDAVEGMIVHGWITGVEDYGCFVSFYNDVKGLAHRTELGLSPGTKANVVFQVGECVKCRVLRVDVAAHRLSLSFSTSPNREEDVNKQQNILPGSVVSGTIVYVKKSIVLDVPAPQGIMKGVLSFPHLSDCPGHVELLKSFLVPGQKLERLLVLESLNQKLHLSAKFSMLQSVGAVPSDISHLHQMAVYPGFIASVTEKGCFVRFLDRLTGLASIRNLSDGFVKDITQVYSVGQSVRAQVLEVNEEKRNFFVSLKQSACFSTDASLIQGYFLEEEKIFELQTKSIANSNVEWGGDLQIGGYVEGEIQEIKEYGVIVNLSRFQDLVGFLTHYQVGTPVEVGKKVKARVLDVVKTDGIVDLTLREELFSQEIDTSGKRNKESLKRKSTINMELYEKVTAVVELVKDEYLVLSLPSKGNAIAFASTHDYNSRVLDTHQQYRPGHRLSAIVYVLANEASGGRHLVLLATGDVDISTSKKARKGFKCDVGSLVQGKILSVEPLCLTLLIENSMKGSIHVTEVWDEYQEGHLLSTFKIGQTLTAKVINKSRSWRTRAGSACLELSIRPSELSDSNDQGENSRGLPSLDTVMVGQLVTAYVQEVNEERAWLLLAPHLRGRLFNLDSSDEPQELEHFREKFKVGHALRCYISGVDHTKGTLDLSLKSHRFNFSPLDSNHSMQNAVNIVGGMTGLRKGSIVGGRVAKVWTGLGGLNVQIGCTTFGRVHVTQFSDIWEDHPSLRYQEGQFVKCAVLEVCSKFNGRLQVELSLKASLVRAEDSSSPDNRVEKIVAVETIQDLSLGLLVQGYVKTLTSKGCFVTLSRFVEARILLSNLSDNFLTDPAKIFVPGKVVKGRICRVEPISGQVDMTLKSGDANGAVSKNLLEGFHVGDVVNGKIRRIETFGIFITIDYTSIVGMCHVSEVSDKFIPNLEDQYKVGQKVCAKILQVDKDKWRLSLGMKQSYLNDSKKINQHMINGEIRRQLEDAPALSYSQPLDSKDDNQDDEEGNLTSESNSEDDLQTDDDRNAPPPGDVAPLEVNLELEMNNSPEVSGEDNFATEEDVTESKAVNKRMKKRHKKQREETIRAAEEKRLEEGNAPETADDFEMLVRASPNSSFVWIKYMAFMLSIAEADQARAIAERALQTINFRDEGEKLNVWIAYLNLENVYGNPPKEAVLQTFQKALQSCDPMKLYLALLGIYEHTEQHDMCDQLLKTMTRKFKASAKVWLRYVQNLVTRGKEEAGRRVFDQSLKILPRRKHIKVITQVAIMEFKNGSPERGRTLFEGVLRNYPKRTDLWSVYLDQEIRLGDTAVVRGLFDRALCLELAPKKMKFFFKKYLDYEKQIGDEAKIALVKWKALEYVETKLC